uniref:Putative aspartate--trna ligase mitochondrial isoform x2 n=2 Tax=Nyssomyia neivai TaxID=330878 RepID=A0A1L8DFU7_9DIPT
MLYRFISRRLCRSFPRRYSFVVSDFLFTSPCEIYQGTTSISSMAYRHNMWMNQPPNKMFRPNRFDDYGPGRFDDYGPMRFDDYGPGRFDDYGPNRFDDYGPSRFDDYGPNRFDDFRPYPPPLMSRRLDPVERPLQISCGGLRNNHHGMLVELYGRVMKQQFGRFLLLKDTSGYTQLIANSEDMDISIRFQKMPVDAQLRIIGRCKLRPPTSRNRTIPTGEVEVHVQEILSVRNPYGGKGGKHNVEQKRQMSTSSRSCLGITAPELAKAKGTIREYFDKRKITCGELRMDNVGQKIRLVGWLENSQRHGRFFRMRDGTGYCQVTVDAANTECIEEMGNVMETDVVFVEGTVTARPPNSRNTKSDTGDIEVIVSTFKLLSPEEPYIPSGFETIGDKEEDPDELFKGEEKNGDGDQEMTTEVKTPKEEPKPLPPNTNLFTCRTHNCGELTMKNVGENVVLSGWLGFQRMKKFFTVRDGYGTTQVIIPQERAGFLPFDEMSYESIVKVAGIVTARPPQLYNQNMSTGEIEVLLEDFEVLNESSKNLPMEVREFNRAKETLRLEHRYIDLRFMDMQKNLRTRSAVLMKMREFLINKCAFVEVETPTLFRATPGGAQEFIVPSRKRGHFYSLVQSPQQFKQLLMVGAIDRYFQIARCYRDEATRSDRQPEFTQLDIELSFTDRDKVMELIEELLVYSWPSSGTPLKTPFQRMTYDEVMSKYGSDKPDLRFEHPFTDVTEQVKLNEELQSTYNDFVSYAIVLKTPQNGFPTSLKNTVANMIKDLKETRLFVSKLKEETIEAWTESNISNSLSAAVTKALAEKLALEQGDLLFLAIGQKNKTQELMGNIRNVIIESLISRNLVKRSGKGGLEFLWVTDFPLFARTDDGKYESVHHPFTAPYPEDVKTLRRLKDLESIRSLAYDLVINGKEVGGGSIRIHKADLQKFILERVLQIDHTHLKHLITALGSGCPPHGGIALGIDRLMAIICNAETIRDVIAFPKGLHGKDHMSQAPIELSSDELNLYHIAVKSEKEDSSNGSELTQDDPMDATSEESSTKEQDTSETKMEQK